MYKSLIYWNKNAEKRLTTELDLNTSYVRKWNEDVVYMDILNLSVKGRFKRYDLKVSAPFGIETKKLNNKSNPFRVKVYRTNIIFCMTIKSCQLNYETIFYNELLETLKTNKLIEKCISL